MSFTERFTERWQLLDTIPPSSSSAEQNTGWISMANFQRVVFILQTGAIEDTGTVDLDIEVGTTSAGGTTATLKSITQLTTADDNKVVVVEVRGEEMNVAGVEYDYIQGELTGANAAGITALQVWGYCEYAPAVTTLIDEIVD
ncbi:MAG: hypothetical protein WC565_05700 [Parcubacteria group bacterium]